MTQERPEGVPEDWELVNCMNPECPYTVWVPQRQQLLSAAPMGVPVVTICSAACAQTFMEHAMLPGQG